MNKKVVGIIIALAVIIVALVCVIAYMFGKNSNKEVTTLAPTESQVVSTQATTVAKNDVDSSDIKVVKTYKFYDEEDFKMVMVLEHTGKSDAAVAVVAKVYDGANAVIGTERESIFMDPGSKSVVSFDFDTEGVKVKNDDYKISVAAATSLRPGLNNIESKSKTNGNVVSVASTNTGNFDLQGVEAHVLFYQDDELVDIESEDVGNEASEVFEKGTTRTQQFDTHEKFNKVEVYYSQDQDKPDSDDDD